MSFLKDVIKFEKFNLKDMWGKVKDDPERLLLGAMDPFSTRMWNQTGIGKDWEPVVDQMGGAYGGSALSVGDTGEGVYGRARAAGVPTGPGAQMHDVAHVISSMFAGGYGADKLGALGGGSNFLSKIPKQLPNLSFGQSQPQPLPPFISSGQQGFLPAGQPGANPSLAQLLRGQGGNTQNAQSLAMLAALLRSQNG